MLGAQRRDGRAAPRLVSARRSRAYAYRPAAPVVVEHRRVGIDRALPFRIVAVADTHSRPDPRAQALIAGLAPAFIVHGGDIGDLAVLDELAQIAPVHAVRGNIDARDTGVPEALVLDLEGPACPPLRILLEHIVLLGPRLRAEARRLALAERPDLYVCGHSHVPFLGRDAGTTVFNPGSIGPRRFGLPIVFGVIEVSAEAIRAHHVDCETGRAWAPGPLPPP